MKRSDLEKFIDDNQQEVNALYNTLKDGNTTDVLECLLNDSFDNFLMAEIPGKDSIDFHLNVAMEECAELIQSISKLRRAKLTKTYNSNKEEIYYMLHEEMADVIMNVYRLMVILDDDNTEKNHESAIYKILAVKLLRYKKYSEKCFEEGKL